MLGKNLIKAAATKAQPLYIEDVMSTWLYTGNGSTQTITNGIDLAGEGGLVWIKRRDATAFHRLYDTERGAEYGLFSNDTSAQVLASGSLTNFNSDGFSVGSQSWTNTSAATYASWTFRKAEKFFDVVTYTGTGSARTVAHNLGSVPGCIMVKRTDTSSDWQVYHRANTANPETDYLVLNSTAATADSNTRWNDTAPTSSEFTVGTEATVNASGGTYVAYLFAHDAGGFGDDGTESVIKCGSYTSDGFGNPVTIDLGWEPQWILLKRSDGISSWFIIDSMRGIATGGNDAELYADSSTLESTSTDRFELTATGFKQIVIGANQSFTYIAIRRGPMKTPESGTEVFKSNYETEARSTTGWTSLSGFPDDAFWMKCANVGFNWELGSRLTVKTLSSNTTSAEQVNQYFGWDTQDGIKQGTTSLSTISSHSYADYHFRRAPGFFDVVAYTGTGSARTVAHNLGVVPELMIVKVRSTTYGWNVWSKDIGSSDYMELHSNIAASAGSTYFNSTAPTSSAFTVGTAFGTNRSAFPYIAYLFATCPGVSKVGSYTGTGTTLQIDCGFASGSRLVLIKRTDSTGNWYIWDSARGIVSGDDPYLLINSTAAEVTNTDYIDPYSAGFEISSSAPAEINADGGSYIYLSVA